MLKLTRWCIAHRRAVVVAWVAVAVLTTVLASAAGRNYATDFSLPGTESQHALDLLNKEFKTQAGDVDTVVFHTSQGTINSPDVHAAMTKLQGELTNDPHVVSVLSPYTTRGAVEVSKNQSTAFFTLNFDKRANNLPNSTGKPVINQVNAVHVPGLQVAAGGQVIEQAEGFNIGPATAVGVVAALIILLITFGALVAAAMPLITAGLGLITGVALIGLGTHVLSMSNVSPELALMIGLGVGIDYALFIVTRFKENYLQYRDIERSVVEAMDTSGRAVLLAGATVVIALLGMFATGVSFMYGLAIASVLAVLLVMVASLTVLPAVLSRFGHKIVRQRGARRGLLRRRQAPAAGLASPAAGLAGPGAPAGVTLAGSERSRWREWSRLVQRRPWPLATLALLAMLVFLIPVFAMRLETSDAGNDPSNTTSRHAFDLLAQGFGAGFNGPLTLVAQSPHPGQAKAAIPALSAAVAATHDVVAVTPSRVAPSGTVAVMEVYPGSAPQANATSDLVNHLRGVVIPPVARKAGVTILVGGFTAGSIDFSSVLAGKLPLFIGLVVVLSALLLFVMFRSLVIPIQAAIMNLLSIGGALGATVAVFQDGILGSVLGVEKGPIEPWIPVIMFAVVFGLSMDYEVFLVSRVREEWIRGHDASDAVADGIAFTGRVITAAAAIMVCVFLSFMLGNERSIREFGFGLAAAVFLDALIVRCVLLPAVLEIIGPSTWRLPRWLDARLPHINIEGTTARALTEPGPADPDEATEREPARA
ncbi:MAG TPA: MMPL family transporter [Solirubrobacteraceae bacterium]|jgi:RND superfamily putative drug exporter|nr:MMPL family transporter [Solirubrobacteraceae bacterium]